MDLRDTLLTLFRAKDYVPMREEEIIAVLKLNPAQSKKARTRLKRMLEHGEIARLKKDRLCIPNDADLVSSKIMFRLSGSAIFIPDDPRIIQKPSWPNRPTRE